MSITLKVTPERLQEMSGEVTEQLNRIEKQFNEINNEISRTRSYWEGAASEAHMAQYDSMKDSISEIVKRLKSHPENLLKMAGLYTQTEAANEQIGLSLADDVIV